MKTELSFYRAAIILACLCLTGCSETEDPENHFTFMGVDYPLKGGVIENYGSYDNIYNLDVYLFSSGISYDEVDATFEGTGHMVFLEMYCSESCLKNGTYEFDPDYGGDAGTFDLGMFVINLDNDTFEGTFIIVSSGSITVSVKGSTYEMTFDCKANNNETVTGYYKGELNQIDSQGSSSLLLTPGPNETLDNGCYNSSDPISWYFDWSDYPYATSYNLYVIGQYATYPIIDAVIPYSEFQDISYGYISDANRLGWTWKVRAFANGEWQPWSETRVFNVEPANTDCP